MRSAMSFKGCNFVAYRLLYVKIRNQDELGNFNSFLQNSEIRLSFTHFRAFL